MRTIFARSSTRTLRLPSALQVLLGIACRLLVPVFRKCRRQTPGWSGRVKGAARARTAAGGTLADDPAST